MSQKSALSLFMEICQGQLMAIFEDNALIRMSSQRHNVNGKEGLTTEIDTIVRALLFLCG